MKNYAKLTGQQLRKDEHGNAFRYQGSYDAGWKQVGDGRQSDIREMYDVYLLVEEPSNE